MNLFEVTGQWGHFETNKSCWIRLYASISSKIKNTQNISSKTVHSVFTSKFISHYLYLLFIIFIIYLQSPATVFFTTGTTYRTTGSSVKSTSGITFVGKCRWLVYLICLTYTLFFIKQFYKNKSLGFGKNLRASQEQNRVCCPAEHKNNVSRLAIYKIIRTEHQNRAWLSLILYCM